MEEKSDNRAMGVSDACVAIVTPYEPSPSETFIRSHIENMPARTVLVHSWPPTVDGRTVLPLPVRAFYKLRRELFREGLQPEMTAAYVKALRRHGARAVLAEYGTTGVIVMEACRKLKLPLVVHFFGYDASVREVLEEHAESYPQMFAQAEALLVVSRAMQRKLISLGAPPEKVIYNPCVADCRQFEVSDPAAAPPTFLAVGRFVEKKAPQLTLRAFAEVLKACPEARLRMVGYGPLLEECQQLAAELGLTGAVTFPGGLPHEAVREEMRGVRAFVQHSIEAPNGDCEGTPVGILEAGAAGLPVVSTRHAGIPDVVVEEQTGLLVDERDVHAMAEQMIRLVREPALARELGRAARRHVETNFSRERSDAQLWAVIESCIINRAAGLEKSPVLA